MLSAPRLDTPRLTLRPLAADDADAIVDGVGNYDVVRWLSQVPYPYSRADAQAFLATAVDELTWAIEHKGGLVGVISLKDDLGYWLGRSVWGQGFAFEAAQAALASWFDDPERGDMIARHYLDNARSELVLRCLGFRPEGVVHLDALALNQKVACRELRLTREDWQARRTFDVATRRLRLRELARTDAHKLVNLTTASVVRMVSSIPGDLSVAAAKAFINRRRWQGLPGFLLAIDGPDGEMIGCIGCGGQPVTAMIFLGEKYWGQGYAAEASEAFVAELFDRFPLNAIHAERFVDNIAVAKVIEGLGFHEIGRHDGRSEARVEPAPVVEYRLTRDAFQARQ